MDVLSYLAQHMSEIFWTIMSAGALGLAGWCVKRIIASKKTADEEHKILKNGLLWIEHDILLKQCRFYLQEKKIDVSSLENLTGLYESYKALGGNGTIKNLYARIQELEIVEDDGID